MISELADTLEIVAYWCTIGLTVVWVIVAGMAGRGLAREVWRMMRDDDGQEE